MIAIGLLAIGGMNPLLVIFAHLGLLILLWWRSRGVNLEDKSEISQFYQFIWKLFFLEYLIFPLACLL
jgi:homogentisate phytyltransferase/homogentisate geranylgeranyltransferase